MRFEIVRTNQIEMRRALVYRPKEFSFDVTPSPGSSVTSVLLNDLNLEVDEDGKVVSVWGMCPHTRWRDLTLVPPIAGYGELFVVTDTPFQAGISQRLTPKGKYLPVFVDREGGWVKIQGAASPESVVMILPGVIFELGHEGGFCSLWLRPQSGISLPGEICTSG